MERYKPNRGLYGPGEKFYYNSWDFNVAGRIFEITTGLNIYEAFYNDIAQPLGMLDYKGEYTTIDGEDPASRIPNTDGFYQYERKKTRYPAFHFRMSAHDMALYGALYLNRGLWEGRQTVPAAWIDASTRAYSVTNAQRGLGYGMLWNVLINSPEPNKSFYHTGVGDTC